MGIWSILAGYLAGSVPFAFLLARRAGIDVRRAGSGNVGAANVLRTTGVWRGVIVMALDVAKGAAAVALAYLTSGGSGVAALSGTAAVVGHIYPVWLRFHGGKGVAVAAGVFAILTPIATAANLMVMEPGGYKFSDYWKLGLLMLLLFMAAAVLLVPVFWPF